MFRFIRFHFRLIYAFAKKYRGVIGAGTFIGVVSFWLVPHIWSNLPNIRNVTRVAIVGKYSLSDIPLSIQSKISFGLTTISDSQEIKPGIAKDWSVSEDGKVYIFNIREDLNWHDGTKLKAGDLNYSFRGATIEYPNNLTVVVTLSDPYAALPISLARPAFKSGLIGLGQNKVIGVKKNGVYLEELKLSDGTIYKFYVSRTLAKIAFMLGEVDYLPDVIPGDDLEKWPNVKVENITRYDRYIALFFNTTQLDKPTRQALAYALDKKQWGPRAYGPISPKSWAYFSDVKQYDFDSGKASAIKKLSQITISTLPAYQKDAEMIKTDWEKFGLKVQIVVEDSIPVNFESLIIAQAIPLDPDQYNLWHSTQSTNISKLDDKRIDLLLEEGRKISDKEKRLIIYRDFQKYLLEDLPAIFLYYQTTNTISRK